MTLLLLQVINCMLEVSAPRCVEMSRKEPNTSIWYLSFVVQLPTQVLSNTLYLPARSAQYCARLWTAYDKICPCLSKVRQGQKLRLRAFQWRLAHNDLQEAQEVLHDKRHLRSQYYAWLPVFTEIDVKIIQRDPAMSLITDKHPSAHIGQFQV
jgi:hypothetical protein